MKKLLFFSFFLLVLSPLALASAPSITLNTTLTTVEATTATIAWNTNISTTNNQMWYGLTTGANTLNAANPVNGTTAHQINLTSLEDTTTYYYILSSCENGANCTNSTEATFTTLRDCDNPNNAVACDILEGMPSTGTNLGSFLKNLAPGVGVFMLVVALFLGLVAIVMSVPKFFKVK